MELVAWDLMEIHNPTPDPVVNVYPDPNGRGIEYVCEVSNSDDYYIG
jgi:hypothetical protein